jgi:hypothetical protein
VFKGLLAGVIAIGVLALVVPRPDDPDPGPEKAKAARAAAISSSGSLKHTNSRDGMPIFTASNVGPGTLVEGAVTIANTGSGSGYFVLSKADLTDVPGPNGGALSQKLQMEIRDVTSPSRPLAVYAGTLAQMGVRPLGFIAPAAERDYSFTATIPDTGDPATTISGDNALKGSSTSARFVWTAFEGAPPAAPAKPPPVRDKRPPQLRVSIAKVQRLLTRSFVDTRVRCSEACTLTVTGRTKTSRSFKVRGVRRRVRAGRAVRLRLRLSRPAVRSIRRRLLAGRRVVVRLRFTAVDAAHNRSVVNRTLRLKPRKR